LSAGAAPRLGIATLDRLPPAIAPRHDPRLARAGIIHLGVGNFHRAHQAVYADAALAAGEAGWAVCGINLRSREIVDRLSAQDGLYTLLVRGEGPQTRARIVGALRETIAFPVQPQRAIERFADPAIRIVTMTITEKGYVDGSGGAIALLLDGLARRTANGAGPLTLLSCDNLSLNGNALRRTLTQAASQRRDPALQRFIDERISFPNTMVDRIVPATVRADIDEARLLTGLVDECALATEPFTQWVIEDEFAAGRPDWARDGVQFVRDVAPWEAMKLRLLNAAHSALAYLGVPAGLDTVDQAIADPVLRAFVQRMWREDLIPTLPDAVRNEAPAYCEALLARFANPALGHRLQQIAIDGSQKIPMRWLPAARSRLAAGEVPDSLAAALAAWVRFLRGIGERGERWAISDPHAQQLSALAAAAAGVAGAERDAAVKGFKASTGAARVLAFEPVFADLAGEPRLLQRIEHWLRRLEVEGTRGALK
jgi:fructuronate reductase